MRSRDYEALELERGSGYTIISYEEICARTGIEAIREREGQTGICCHTCGFVSYHPEDVRQRYCGHCHVFHEERRL